MTEPAPNPPLPWRRRLPWIALLPLAAGLQLAAARHPEVVERVYSRGLYPPIAGALAAVSSRVPFALGELLLVGVAVLAVAAAARGLAAVARGRRSLASVLVHGAVATAALAGGVAFAFLVVWGLNYQRLPYAATAGLDVAPATPGELAELCTELAARADELRAGLAEDAEGCVLGPHEPERLAELARAAFEAADLGPADARPKAPLVSPWMTRLGISGIYFPFTAEPNVNARIPAPTVGFSTCHELAHRVGWAREDEANFVAHLACAASEDPYLAYSGAFNALSYATNALFGADPERASELLRGLSPAVQRDRERVRAFWARRETVVTAIGRTVNHAYLKVQREGRGVRSYGRMVDLLIAERRARGEGDRTAPPTPGTDAGG